MLTGVIEGAAELELPLLGVIEAVADTELESVELVWSVAELDSTPAALTLGSNTSTPRPWTEAVGVALESVVDDAAEDVAETASVVEAIVESPAPVDVAITLPDPEEELPVSVLDEDSVGAASATPAGEKAAEDAVGSAEVETPESVEEKAAEVAEKESTESVAKALVDDEVAEPESVDDATSEDVGVGRTAELEEA